MEFELTENKHSKDKKKPLTISACYKTQPNRFRALEAWRILRTAVAGKELDSRIVAKVDFELRQLAGATALTDEGLPERFSSEQVESGSANINDHNASIDDGLPPPRSSEDAVSGSALKRLDESTVDWMADYEVDHTRPRMRPTSKSTPKPKPEADHVLSSSAQKRLDESTVDWVADSDGDYTSVDWGDEEDKEGSEISAALVNELQEKLEISTAWVSKVVEEDEPVEEKCKKVRMMEFKKRCSSGEVRWRALAVAHPDPFIENYLRTMLNDVRTLGVSLWDTIWEPMLTPWRKNAASTSAKTYELCEKLLRDARARSLQATTWGQPGNDSMLHDKQYFFSELPYITMETFEGHIDDSLSSKYQAIKTLLNYPHGEW